MKSKKDKQPVAQDSEDELAATLAQLDAEEAALRQLITDEGLTQEAKLTELQKSFRARKQEEQKRFEQATDSRYWFCMCFLTTEQKAHFLKMMRWFDADADLARIRYIDGLSAAEAEGFDLPPAELRFIEAKPDKRLNEIALPLES